MSGAVCMFDGCPRTVRARKYCKRHYAHLLKYGEPRPIRPVGKGSFHRGYRMLYRPGHPNAERSGRIAEHRLVMSEMLGRALRPGESVRHKNRNRSDNRPENLELWTTRGSHPYGARIEDLVSASVQILREHAPHK